MDSFSESNKKKFGNCKVEWRIDKFSLQTIRKKFIIQSPVFTINGYENTKWCMDLRSKLLVKKGFFVFFGVRRLDIDSGPKRIKLNLKVSHIISGAESICLNDKLLSLKKSSKYEVCFGSMEKFSEIYRSNDIFTVVCHMIVYSNSARREFGDCSHSGLKLLSRNMLELFTSAQNFDIKFIICDKIILAHKAVLYVRNDILPLIIEEEIEAYPDNLELTIVNFSGDLRYKAAEKVLAYLYTGDITHALDEPSFAIDDCASFLDIDEIKNYYEPDKLIIQSTIDFEEYLCILPEYEPGKTSLFWTCQTKEFRKIYRLLYSPRKESIEDHIPLFTRKYQKSMLARLEFHVVNQKGHLKASYIIVDEEEMLKIDRIMDRFIRKLDSSCSINEVNELRIKLILTAGITMSYVEEHSSALISCVNEDFYYERLSADLEYLVNYGPFYDTVIHSNGEIFGVHKFILISRSFSDILIRDEEGESVIISNIDPHIVSAILKYIYTGFLSVETDDDVIEVYKAAVVTHLPLLKSRCSDWLKLISETNRNIRCRAIRLAEKFDDECLKNCVLNHLYERKDIFLMSDPFHLFQDVNACRHCLTEP